MRPSVRFALPAALLGLLPLPVASQSLRQSQETPVRTEDAPDFQRSPMDFTIVDPGGFYTARYPYVFYHNMAGFGIYPYTQDLLDFLSRFDVVWAGNEFPLPPEWVDHLNTHEGIDRQIIFYEFMLAVHFVFGVDNPQSYETWKTDFLENHLFDFYTINPLIPPDFDTFAPGRYAPGLGLLDYYFNFGLSGMGLENFLVNQYYDGKRADWGYDGVFFDLMGSSFMAVGEIQDPNDPNNFINALDQYNALSMTRSNPSATYDENAAAFLSTLRGRNASTVDFPIWGNQAFRSGDPVTGANEYYRHIQADLDESTFTTWFNPDGWTTGVNVTLDGVVYPNATPVETRIVPYFQGVATLQPIIQQSTYALANYGNPVNGVILNYLRPYYREIPGGYEAEVDREAIFYGYATGRVTGLYSFNWDFFDTVATIPGVPGAPPSTGLPMQPYYKWSFDPIYFLDLGEKIDGSYAELPGLDGGSAVFCAFDKGFIVINASSPARDVRVDLAGRLLGEADGVSGYHDHFTAQLLPASTTEFTVAAPYYPIGDVFTNGARIYSYTEEDGSLIGSDTSVTDWRELTR